MRAGFILPGGPAPEQLQQAILAEEHGWDGVFVWEAPFGVDAWTLLGAIAAHTSRIRLGTLLTPLPWRRPWKVASQVVTLDQLSRGRALLTVGLGAIATDLPITGEATDLRTRSELLDEGIDLIRELWAGRQDHRGRHFLYRCGRDDLVEVGRPVQERIPIWVVAVWPRPKSMARALRCDGAVVQYQRADGGEGTPAEAGEVRAWLDAHGAPPDYDLIAQGETPAEDREAAVAIVKPWLEVGCTWWLESRWEMPHAGAERTAQVQDRLRAGPPLLRGGG